MKTVKVGKGGGRGGRGADAGGGGGGGGRGLQLSGQQQDLLASLFERYNASRLNADLIIAGMRRGPGGGGDGDELGPGGVEMISGQLTTWLKKMGLRFKQLTDNQVGAEWRAGTMLGLCGWRGWGLDDGDPPQRRGALRFLNWAVTSLPAYGRASRALTRARRGWLCRKPALPHVADPCKVAPCAPRCPSCPHCTPPHLHVFPRCLNLGHT